MDPQLGLRLRFGAALPGASFSQKNMTFNTKKHDFLILYDVQISLNKNVPNLLLTRGTTIKTCILTPLEFWWVP